MSELAGGSDNSVDPDAYKEHKAWDATAGGVLGKHCRHGDGRE